MTQMNFETPVSEADKYGNPKDIKKMKLEAIRSYHAGLITDLGISPMDFNMKMPFYDKYGRYVVGIFASEFKKEKGFFFELIDRDLNPLEPDRKVYRIPKNDSFEDEYEMNERGSFLVPLDELRVINPAAAAVSKDGILSNDKVFTSRQDGGLPAPKNPTAGIPVPKPAIPQQSAPAAVQDDALYSEMTIRDYIAIHTGKPVSNKPWLNKLLQTL